VPSESVFSRVFAAFAKTQLPGNVHETLVKSCCEGQISGHISRDSTAIEAREKPEKKKSSEPVFSRKGRPRKGETPKTKELSRMQKQQNMSLEEMLKELPTACNCGSKKNSQGFVETWIGYKLHIDTADRGIPISAILTSASLHDSQVAIPLATTTVSRVQNFYDCMDSAYDVPEIVAHSRQLDHVPLIDVNPRRNVELKEGLVSEEKARSVLNWEPSEAIRYNARTSSERTNARLKDEFGGRTVQVKGPVKVYCHLMFGILALTADQLLRLFG
jgi:hypothetical protein